MLVCAMRKMATAATTFTSGERDYVRRELDMFFLTCQTVAEVSSDGTASDYVLNFFIASQISSVVISLRSGGCDLTCHASSHASQVCDLGIYPVGAASLSSFVLKGKAQLFRGKSRKPLVLGDGGLDPRSISMLLSFPTRTWLNI